MIGALQASGGDVLSEATHLRVSAQLNFAALTQAEKATFEAGLRTRVMNRLRDAITRPTAEEYQRACFSNLGAYTALIEILRIEIAHGSDPVTDEDVMQALAHVERDLGEPWRHKLEHAINISQSARQILARVGEGTSGPDHHQMTPVEVLGWMTQWSMGWTLLNWSTDCVFMITHQGVAVASEVVEVLFRDIGSAADNVYALACELYDKRFGDPDEE